MKIPVKDRLKSALRSFVIPQSTDESKRHRQTINEKDYSSGESETEFEVPFDFLTQEERIERA
jgi:hypothetical protein